MRIAGPWRIVDKRPPVTPPPVRRPAPTCPREVLDAIIDQFERRAVDDWSPEYRMSFGANSFQAKRHYLGSIIGYVRKAERRRYVFHIHWESQTKCRIWLTRRAA